MLINATIQEADSGFFIDGRFHGRIYSTLPENGNLCVIRTDFKPFETVCFDLSTVTILDLGGTDVTPATNTEKTALINQYVHWGRLSISLPPLFSNVVQWLGNTFKDSDGTYKQEDKKGDRSGEVFDGGGVFNYDGTTQELTITSDTTGLTNETLEFDVITTKPDFAGVYDSTSKVSRYILACEQDSTSTALFGSAVSTGSPNLKIYIDDIELNIGVTTRDDVYLALADGELHTVKIENFNMADWTNVKFGLYGGLFSFSGEMARLSFSNKEFWFEEGDGSVTYNTYSLTGESISMIGSGNGFTTNPKAYSYRNEFGGNIVGGVFISASQADLTKDVQGNALINEVGRVKYNPLLKSGTFTSDATTNYAPTGYSPELNTVFAVKGRWKRLDIVQYHGSVDAGSSSMCLMGINSGTNKFRYGFGDQLFDSTLDSDTNHHVFILNKNGFWVLPVNTDISNPVKIKNILDNTAPTDTLTGTAFGVNPFEIYLSALNNNGTTSQRSNFEHIETQILEYDGVDITLIDKWYHSSTKAINYNKIRDNHITWVGDTTSAYTLSRYQYPDHLFNGYDLWIKDSDSSELFVAFYKDGNSIKTDGDSIAGYTWNSRVLGTAFGHNRCETVYNQPVAPALISVADQFTTNPWYDVSNNPIDVEYSTISYNYETKNLWFADVLSKAPVKFNWLVYGTPVAEPDLTEVYKFEKSVEPLLDSEGQPLFDINGEQLYALKEGLV